MGELIVYQSLLDLLNVKVNFCFLMHLNGKFLEVLLLKTVEVRKRAKIRNRYNQAPHLTQDTNGNMTTSQLDITNESEEVSSFPAININLSKTVRSEFSHSSHLWVEMFHSGPINTCLSNTVRNKFSHRSNLWWVIEKLPYRQCKEWVFYSFHGN